MPAEFWRMTFAEMNLIISGFNERERRDNHRAAMVVAALYNVNMNTKKRKKPYTPAEILGEDKQDQSMIEVAKNLTIMFGGKVGDGVVERCQK